MVDEVNEEQIEFNNLVDDWTSYKVPEKSLILYEIELELKNKQALLCTFSRAYIQ
jgi:hypothetical protein